MAVLHESSTFQTDIVFGLRRMAAAGDSLEMMVLFVQSRLGFSREFIVPVLGYFCEAFSLPLSEVLPVREWWDTRDMALSNQFEEKFRARQLGQKIPEEVMP